MCTWTTVRSGWGRLPIDKQKYNISLYVCIFVINSLIEWKDEIYLYMVYTSITVIYSSNELENEYV